MAQPLKAILFDFDGTLRDAWARFYQAFCAAQKYFGHPQKTIEEVYALSAPPWHDLYRKLAPGVSPDAYHEFFKNNTHLERACLRPNVHETLSGLKQSGIELGLVSAATPEGLTESCCQHGLTDYFNFVTADRPFKTEAIKDYYRSRQINSRNVAYVGDMPSDVEHGRGAGVITIGYTGIFQPNPVLAATKPDYLIDDLIEIVKIAQDHGMEL